MTFQANYLLGRIFQILSKNYKAFIYLLNQQESDSNKQNFDPKPKIYKFQQQMSLLVHWIYLINILESVIIVGQNFENFYHSVLSDVNKTVEPLNKSQEKTFHTFRKTWWYIDSFESFFSSKNFKSSKKD